MKSVCFVVQSDYELDNRVRRKAEALVAAGYSVDVLALRRLSQPQKRYVLNGVNVSTVSLGKRRGSIARYVFEYLAFFLWALGRVTLQMRRRQYVVIDVNTLPDVLIFAAIVAKWMGARLVLDMHEITPEFYISKYGAREDSWVVRGLKRVERWCFRLADHVITINEPIRELFAARGLPESKSTVITNAVDEARFTSAFRESRAIDVVKDPGAFVMMYHGTLTRIYGLDIAIEAFRLAQAEMPSAQLWILGGGPEEDSLARLARQHGLISKVKLVGLVSPGDIPAWLSKCDVGILPLRRDVFLEFASPNKLAEFVVMGKPVVMSRLKAVQYYFSETALAYFEPNSPADLAKQMVRVYRDGELRARLAAQARTEYAPIRWDVMKQRYLRLMEEVVTSGKPTDERSLVRRGLATGSGSASNRR